MALYSKHFYHQIIRKYVIAFGTLFSNINVLRKSSSGSELHRENVPLTFASKEKFYQRLVQDYSEESRISIKLPHIAFEITDYQYDTTRKINSKRTFGETDTEGSRKYFYNPIPYNIGFNLYVFSKTQEEGLQIVEQILPFFTPDYVLTLKLTELDTWKTDIPVNLNSVNVEDTYEGDFETRRSIVWTLNFTLRGYLLGPIRKQKIILNAKINTYITDNLNQQPVLQSSSFPGNVDFTVFESIDDTVGDIIETNIQTDNNLVVSKLAGIVFFVEVTDDDNVAFNFIEYNIDGYFRKSLSSDKFQMDVTEMEPGLLKVELTEQNLANVPLGLYKFFITIENKNDRDLLKVIDGFFNIVD